jgi:glucokinase
MSVAADRRPPYYLGIDLGGTNIKSGVVDDQGRALSFEHIETEAALGPEAGLDHLGEVARRAVAASGLGWDEIVAVGLGSPGTMDIQAGLLLDPPNLPGWDNWPIREKLAERLAKPTVLQNDANAAAYGEYWVGAGRGTQSLVLFTLGTGIGGGIIDHGRIVEGRHSHGGECGHIIIQMDNPRLCSCGQYGHLEAYASATSLVKRAHEALAREDSMPLRQAATENRLTSRAIAEAAIAGDPLAYRLIRETARYLAVGAVSLIHTIDPDIVLFSGGMIAAGPAFLDAIRSDIQAMAFPVPAARVRVEYAELGGEAGVIGAAGCARMAVGSPAGPVVAIPPRTDSR